MTKTPSDDSAAPELHRGSRPAPKQFPDVRGLVPDQRAAPPEEGSALVRRPLGSPGWPRWLWLLVGVGVLVGGISMVDATSEPSGFSVQMPPAEPSSEATRVPLPLSASGLRNVWVHYQVIGLGQASEVSYASGDASSVAQRTPVSLPWSQDINIRDEFFVPSLSARNAGSGQITCRIAVNGAVVSEVTTEGSGSIAICTGNAIG